MADRSFEDDFNDAAGGAPAEPAEAVPPSDTPAPAEANQDAEPLAEAPPPPEPAAPADPGKPPTWDELIAALPAEQAARFKPLVEHAGKELHRLRSDAGRVSAMQHLYHEAKSRAEAEAARAEEAEARRRELEARAQQPLTHAEKAELKEEVDAFGKEFPEFSDAVNMRIEASLKKLLPQLQPPAPPAAGQEAPAGQRPAQTPADDTAVEDLSREYAALDAAHPDWQQASASTAFKSWKEAQGAEVRRLIDSNAAADAIRVLDRFKTDLAVVRRRQELVKKDENRRRLEQNVSIKGSPARPTAIPNDFEAAFNYYATKS